MKHFSPAEFHAFDKMDGDFLTFLDAVRDKAGIPFTLTSDYRTPENNAAQSGSSKTSLHLSGRAVDFVLDDWSRENWWKVTAAVVLCSENRSVELELVHGPADAHCHLGLFSDDRPSRLVLNLT